MSISDDLQRAVFDQLDVAIIAVNGQGGVVFLNDGAARLLDVPLGSYLGQPVQAVLGAPPPATSELPTQCDYAISIADGETRWVRGAWREVQVGGEKQPLRIMVGRDHTRERNLQRDLLRSAALAELGIMAAEVAHEVNNPATYLLTNLSILRDDLTVEQIDVDSALELIEECLDGVSRITDVVKRMRSLASSGSEEIGDTLVDLSTVVHDACRIAGLRVKYKAELHVHEAGAVRVRGSGKRLGQVVLNLVVNAADALSGQSDPLPRIDVFIKQEDGSGWVIVRDNGPGVPPAKRDRIFQAFVTSKDTTGGTGLGLAVSRTIAEEHGGTLTLASGGGRGAEFRLRVPLPQ